MSETSAILDNLAVVAFPFASRTLLQSLIAKAFTMVCRWTILTTHKFILECALFVAESTFLGIAFFESFVLMFDELSMHELTLCIR